MQEKYREAIRLAPIKSSEEKATYFANAAEANNRMEAFQEAIKDASTSLRMRPSPSIKVKALVRRAQAYEKTGENARAYQDLEQVLSNFHP